MSGCGYLQSFLVYQWLRSVFIRVNPWFHSYGTLSGMPEAVRVRQEILKEMLEHARREPQIECCGLLAGHHDIITTIFPAQNALRSPTAFEIAPPELFRFFRDIRERGRLHLGLYHSHPTGENIPSQRDIEQAYYPAQAYFIVSPGASVANPVRVFLIRDGVVREIEIEEVE
jgi:proteasome lid subunit RPN8/RPN11